ncbi:MAG: Double zinc ribbon [Gemmatimonadetes bacterium]|nr:Double zinc ribbon [Gemmatimonadota bacterium]
MPACSNCGQPLAASDERCPRCGQEVVPSAADDESDATLIPGVNAPQAGIAPTAGFRDPDATLIPAAGFEGLRGDEPAGIDTASDETLRGASLPRLDTPARPRDTEGGIDQASDDTMVRGPAESDAPAREDPARTAAEVAGASTGDGEDDGPTVTCAVCGAEHPSADSCPACGTLTVEMPCAAHPDRKAHSRCVFCGTPVCEAEAERGRSPAKCAEHRGIATIEDWAQVFSTATEMEAQLLAENLRAEGIDSQIYAQADRIFPVDLGELSIVRLLVPVWEHGQALAVIRSYMDARGEVAFACAECGEVNEPEAEACASCGASRTA